MSEEMLNFHEKVETIMEEEEKLLSCHVNAIKEDAKMLTDEGRLISMVQGEGVVDYDIDEYVKKMEKLVKHKIMIYTKLAQRLQNFKQYLNEEEEVSHNMTRNRGN
jgi:kinesin family protein 2/24